MCDLDSWRGHQKPKNVTLASIEICMGSAESFSEFYSRHSEYGISTRALVSPASLHFRVRMRSSGYVHSFDTPNMTTPHYSTKITIP